MTERGGVLLGLGANLPSLWGEPEATLRRALDELAAQNVRIVRVSPFYRSEPVGQTRQSPYVNAAALVHTARPPAALLRLLKQIERAAGRRGGRPWGSRTLDIDILDYAGRVVDWRGGESVNPEPGRRALVLPHPQLHRRPFVLRPLLDVAPDWRHPAMKVSGRRLWRGIAAGGAGRVLGAA